MWSRAFRGIPVILGCSGAAAGGVYAKGVSPGEAALCGLFFAAVSSGLFALVLVIRQLGRSTRPEPGPPDPS